MFSKLVHSAIDIWIKIGWFLPFPMMEGNQRIKLTEPNLKIYLAFRYIFGLVFTIFFMAFISCLIAFFFIHPGFSLKKILFIAYLFLETGLVGIFFTTVTLSSSLLTQKILYLDSKLLGSNSIR